ncbi:MAG: hypothetical protein RLZZ283_308 [Candidatus Parcubacteria bacterium]|jgi:hypothetical protein
MSYLETFANVEPQRFRSAAAEIRSHRHSGLDELLVFTSLSAVAVALATAIFYGFSIIGGPLTLAILAASFGTVVVSIGALWIRDMLLSR